MHGLAQHVQDLQLGLSTHNPDIVVLTETHMGRGAQGQGLHAGALKRALAGYWCRATSAKGCDGVVIAVRGKLAKWGQARVVPTTQTANGRLLHVVLTLPHSPPLHVLGAYMPPGSEAGSLTLRTDIETAIAEKVGRAVDTGGECIVAGDFNAVLQPQDRSSGHTYRADVQHAAFVEKCRLRPLDPCGVAGRAPTFRQEVLDLGASSSRIDDVLTTQVTAAHNAQVTVLPPTATSDHCPLLARITASSMRLLLPSDTHQGGVRNQPTGAPVLVRPISSTDQQRFRDAVGSGRLAQQVHDLSSRTQQLRSEHMEPHMQLRGSTCGKKVVILDVVEGRPAIEVVNEVCNQLVDTLALCMEAALQVCATKPGGKHGKHMQPRTVGRKRRTLDS